MDLFINYQFLFEVQLSCLRLHIEVLSFEDSEWSRGHKKMECQVEELEHFWHILLFKFNRGAIAAETARNICAVYWDNSIIESMARKGFSHFKEDRFGFSDTLRPRRPSGFDKDRLNTLIHSDPRQCTRELANVMNCDHSTIVRHWHSMGKVQKSGVWVTAFSKPKPQKSTWSYVHPCLLVIDWLVNNIDHSYAVSLLETKNDVFMLT